MTNLNLENIGLEISVSALLVVFVFGLLMSFSVKVQANTDVDASSNVHYDRAYEIQQSAIDSIHLSGNFIPPKKELIDEAIQELEKSIQLAPEFIKAYDLLIFFYKKFVLYEESDQSKIDEVKAIIEQLYKKTIELESGNPERAMKIFFLKKKGGPERETIIKEIIDSSPNYALANLHYAHELNYKNQNPKAIEFYQKYIRMQYEQGTVPRGDAIEKLWELLTEQQSKDEAVDMLLRFSDSEVPRLILSDMFSRLDISSYPERQYPELYKKAQEIENYEDFINIEQAKRHLENGQLGMAMESYGRQIDINPYGTYAIRSFAAALDKKGHYREAYQVYEALLDSNNRITSKCAELKSMKIRIDYLGPGSWLPEKLVKLCNTWVTLVE